MGNVSDDLGASVFALSLCPSPFLPLSPCRGQSSEKPWKEETERGRGGDEER